jgi:hypothetical protein
VSGEFVRRVHVNELVPSPMLDVNASTGPSLCERLPVGRAR